MKAIAVAASLVFVAVAAEASESTAVADAPVSDIDHVRVAIEADRSAALYDIAQPLGWTVEPAEAPAPDDDRYGIDVGAPEGEQSWFTLTRPDCCDLLAFHQLQHVWEAQDGDPYFRIEFLNAAGVPLGQQDQ
ncbi:hypothetical protein B5C34_10590 [Pacificimonas flava]|uniref:Lipoprotein n=2 Tax=Pacificimonas TaxID=1960290 RepID=A0A219B689_9SPHN|nr:MULTISPECIES: hypothetical protein [Pacificimonas]MBZ6378883.1 hypothetical protein [Pacificimonas aurantium]OWV33865.1 hypothetical protein B5C34_10590 [Pacificimonas flava]